MSKLFAVYGTNGDKTPTFDDIKKGEWSYNFDKEKHKYMSLSYDNVIWNEPFETKVIDDVNVRSSIKTEELDLDKIFGCKCPKGFSKPRAGVLEMSLSATESPESLDVRNPLLDVAGLCYLLTPPEVFNPEKELDNMIAKADMVVNGKVTAKSCNDCNLNCEKENNISVYRIIYSEKKVIEVKANSIRMSFGGGNTELLLDGKLVASIPKEFIVAKK